MNRCKEPESGRAALRSALASEGISSGRGSGWALLAAEQLPPPAITKSDAAFAAEGLEFVVGHDSVSLSELNDLFHKVCYTQWVGAVVLCSHASV